MENLLGLLFGIGLSAACGFRVFVPLLVLSVGAHTGYCHLPSGFAWAGTTPALIAFAVATIVEVLGFMIPWFDHLLDVLAIPAAIAAGTVMTSGMMGEMNPVARWLLGLIAGGGAAAITGMTTATIRGGSTATTGGLANPLFAIAESVTSLIAATISVLAPVLGFMAFLIFFSCALAWLMKRFSMQRRRRMGMKLESSSSHLLD
jgi:hypothetical protein